MIKLRDVAATAGVSEATVSLVLNDRPGVNSATRARVLKVAKELGYTPNAMARGLAMQKSHTVGLVVTDIENPFFGSVTRYVDLFTKKAGYGLILSVSNDNLESEDKILEDFVGKMVDGIIVVPTIRRPREEFAVYERLRALEIEFVFLTSCYPNYDAPCVMTDLAEGSYLLTKHLIELGLRKIVFIATSNTKVIPARERILGFKRALAEAGIAYRADSILRVDLPTYAAGHRAMASYIAKHKPDAVMAINDIVALGAKRAIKEAGLAVPDDVAVAGYDDVVFSSISDVPLTTVRQNIRAMCSGAVDLLLARIAGVRRDEAYLTYIQPELVVRESTEPKSSSVVQVP